MGRYKVISYMVYITLILILLTGLIGGGLVLAAQDTDIAVQSVALADEDEEDNREEVLSIELENDYPIVIGLSGDLFEYDITVKYRNQIPNDKGSYDYVERGFNLSTTVPEGWAAIISGGYPEKELPYVEMDGTGSPEGLNVTFGPYTGLYPEQGEYVCTFRITSTDGVIDETMELIARVTDRYEVSIVSGLTDGNLNPKVTAGKEYHFPLVLYNASTNYIEDVTFTVNKPDDWEVTFDPETINSVESGVTEEIDVIITPPGSTISGDYIVTIKANSEQYTPDSMRLRVTVQTSTLWGGAGVAIVVAVIAGLVVMFMRLGRR